MMHEYIINNYIYVGNNINHEHYFNFTFKIHNLQFNKKNIYIYGYIQENNQYIKIIHSIKLQKLFEKSYIIKLCGVVNNNNCYMPFINFKPIGLQVMLSNTILKKLNECINSLQTDLLKQALLGLLYPTSLQHAQSCIYRLLLYEIAVTKHMLQLNLQYKTPKQIIYDIPTPFELNNYQQNVLVQIHQNLNTNKQTAHLIYGDVGSGKTILAYLSACITYYNHQNVAIMAPNLVLVNQIYNNFTQWNSNLNICKVISSTKQIKCDKPTIFIGTHALLHRELPLLGLLIIDEQHKFGVNQRHKLITNETDLIMLTATPIPRTLNMILSGFLHYSILNKEKQSNYIYIDNIKSIDKIISNIVNKSQYTKIFWVETTIESAENRFEEFKLLQKNTHLVHSKIKNRADIIHEFINGSFGILIGTTVLEVGIDSDINTIVIVNADMLGASQLHQLNGRVGRRDKPGMVILIGKNMIKLREIQKLNNGFEVANWDLKKRGGSNIFATLQSGFKNFVFNYKLHNNLCWEYENEVPLQLINMINNVKLNDEIINFMTQTHIKY